MIIEVNIYLLTILLHLIRKSSGILETFNNSLIKSLRKLLLFAKVLAIDKL